MFDVLLLNVDQSVELKYPSALADACVMPIVPEAVIVPPVIGPVVATLVTVPSPEPLLLNVVQSVELKYPLALAEA